MKLNDTKNAVRQLADVGRKSPRLYRESVYKEKSIKSSKIR